MVTRQREKGGGIEHGQEKTYLSVFSQDTRGNLIDLADELEHWVVGEVAEGKFALRNVSRICLAQNGVAVARNDLAGVQGRPQVVLDRLVAKVVSNRLLHLLEPVKHLLVGPIDIT